LTEFAALNVRNPAGPPCPRGIEGAKRRPKATDELGLIHRASVGEVDRAAVEPADATPQWASRPGVAPPRRFFEAAFMSRSQEHTSRSRIANRLARTLSLAGTVGISVLLVLVIFEVGLRLTQDLASVGATPDPVASLFTLSENESVVFEHARDARVTFPEAVTGAGWNPEWRVSTDSQGLRRNGGDREPPPEAIGICLGDSIMFGAGLNDDETIPTLLSRFVSRSLALRFECLNFGVSNYTTAQEVEFFRFKRGLDRSPIVVVLEIYTNDFKTSPGRMRVTDGRTELVQPGAAPWLAADFWDLRLWKLGVAGSTRRRIRNR
jgi:hypothetical protein